MSSTLDDDELSMSISTTNTRRGGPSQEENRRPPQPMREEEEDEQQVQPVPRMEAAQRTSQRLGQYTLIKTLGEGSFGKVKLAIHQVTGQKVALKIINRRKLVTRDMAGRIEREIQYLQLLRHPHIIKL
jgi:carbon catabolite-derepressing protein kinase